MKKRYVVILSLVLIVLFLGLFLREETPQSLYSRLSIDSSLNEDKVFELEDFTLNWKWKKKDTHIN